MVLMASLMVALAVPSVAPASTSPGLFWLQTPVSAGDSVRVEWVYVFGSIVRPTSRVSIQVLENGRWTTLVKGLPIKRRGWTWVTRNVDKGKATQRYLRASIDRTSLRSPVHSMWIDHIPPVVHITKPAAGTVYVQDESLTPPTAVVSGRTRLEVAYFDEPIPEGYWFWEIGGPVWTVQRDGNIFDFSDPPGLWTLRAIAVDLAGNISYSEKINVLGLPAPP